MELKEVDNIEGLGSDRSMCHDLWPLDEVDPKKPKFPCCIVWTPLPVVSWLAPFIGHVGICREDGVVLDFAGSNFVSVDNFAYGVVARYLQLDREQCLGNSRVNPSIDHLVLEMSYVGQCCFPRNLACHTCKYGYSHTEHGSGITWDDALRSSMHHLEHKSYNLFTCNCHSFVANSLNRLCYGGSMGWNMVSVVGLILLKGKWVDTMSVLRAFFPITVVVCIGILMAGWPFLIGLASFSLLLIGWFLLATYCAKNLLEC